MDTKELKKLLKNSTAVLILDDGEPSFVILDYNSYKNLLSDSGQEKEIRVNPVPVDKFKGRINEKETEILDKINKEILALKDEIEKEEKGTSID